MVSGQGVLHESSRPNDVPRVISFPQVTGCLQMLLLHSHAMKMNELNDPPKDGAGAYHAYITT